MEKKASANGWSALTSSASMDWRQLWNVREAHIAADGMRIAPRGDSPTCYQDRSKPGTGEPARSPAGRIQKAATCEVIEYPGFRVTIDVANIARPLGVPACRFPEPFRN